MIKSNRKAIIIFFLLTLLAIGLFIISKILAPDHEDIPPTGIIATPTPIINTKNQVKWNNFQPGQTEGVELNASLGEPIKSTKTSSGTIFEYKSQSPTLNNQVYVGNDGKVELIKEIIGANEDRFASEIEKEFGETESILYGPEAYSGNYLFIYPEIGLSYLGNPNTDELLEVWYFKPTTLDGFKSQWAKEYNYELKPQF